MANKATKKIALTDEPVRVVSVEICQSGYGETATCKFEKIFDEQNVCEPECLAEVVATAVIAATPYRKWLVTFADAFAREIENHLYTDKTA